MVPRSAILDIEKAQRVTEQLTGEQSLSFSLSGNARKCLEWTGCRQRFTRPFERLIEGTKHHYYDCTPGELGFGATHDITSAYYSLACLAPSPYVILNSKWQPEFLVPKREEGQRWRALLDAVKDHKKFRNIIVGCASKSGSGTVYYDGHEKEGPGFEGLLRPLALLVIRSCLELCALAQKEEMIRRKDNREPSLVSLANTDQILSMYPEVPEVWRRAGLPIKTKASGQAQIYSLQVYKVGERATRWYWRGSRFTGPAISTQLTGPSYVGWLPSAAA